MAKYKIGYYHTLIIIEELNEFDLIVNSNCATSTSHLKVITEILFRKQQK